MITGIDHFLIAVTDVEAAARQVESVVELEVGPGGRHETHGTVNRLCWLGDSYIELISVFDRALARQSWFGRQALAMIGLSMEGPIGLVLASDDLDADWDRLHAAGSLLERPEAGERVRPDGRVVRWRVARAREPDPELGLVFLIEHDVTAAEWTPDERSQRRARPHPLGGPVSLVRVEVPVADMRATTMRLHRDVGLAFRPSLAGGGARDASAGIQTVRLIRAHQHVVPVVVVRGGSVGREETLLSCRWVVEPRGG